MRIVIKVGTSTLTHVSTGLLNIRRIEELCKTISDIKNAGHEIIFVSSGAIAMGVGKLGLSEKPKDLPRKQAAASVGQCELMYIYDKLFLEYNHKVGQILLTNDDIQIQERKENFTNTIDALLSMNCIPVINENDTVSTKEIVIGDNDTLGAVVAKCVQAELYIILSDIDGLYTADPNKDKDAQLIHEVKDLDESIYKLASGSSTKVGTGGMVTKLQAAEIVINNGCDMIIANGKNPDNLYKILDGKKVGTRFIKR